MPEYEAQDSSEVVLETVDLDKVFLVGEEEVKALHEVSISIRRGEYVAIMGPSGSGKSTFLNILGCLDRPTSGAYLLGGRNVAELDDDALSEIRSRYLGFIFQSYNLIAQLDVIENIEVPLFYQGLSPIDSRHRALELAEMVGLGDRVRHRPTQLSGGQQQRVAIARSLANDPLFILADEPTGNLDSATEEEILSILRRLNEGGKTIVMVTHEDRIAHMASRVIRLRDGSVVSDGVESPDLSPAGKSGLEGVS
ncbi:MAG: ABC transporter ATP-binding protein [Planctomycetes bacterium]|nr:ABC transporter ATP-binding protein [Planctomycetota bacterium]